MSLIPSGLLLFSFVFYDLSAIEPCKQSSFFFPDMKMPKRHDKTREAKGALDGAILFDNCVYNFWN